jgi:casein kinase II subunit alpha
MVCAAIGMNHTIAGTLHYKAPEILLRNYAYGPEVDMWSFAALLAGIVFQREPFIGGFSPASTLNEMTKLLGSTLLIEYVNRTGLSYKPDDEAFQHKNHTDLSSLITDKNKHLATPLALDALSNLLRYVAFMQQYVKGTNLIVSFC